MPTCRLALSAAVGALLHLRCDALAGTHVVLSRPHGGAAGHDTPILSTDAAAGPAEVDLAEATALAASASPASAPQRPPLVHFLFLLIDGFLKPELWAEYFKAATPGTYMLWAHCVDREGCEKNYGAKLLGARLVPTVYNRRGIDLMTPFVQLLRSAMAETAEMVADGGMPEKFVLVSDSTLPVKPFPVAYDWLTSTRTSDICFQTVNQWAKGSVDGVPMMLAKHHQWVALSRGDASLLVRDWAPVLVPRSYDVPLRDGRFAGQNRTAPRSAFTGGSWYTSTDEEATYAFIRGPVEIRYKGDLQEASRLFQNRRCTTYVGFPNDVGLQYKYSGDDALVQVNDWPWTNYETYPVTKFIVDDKKNQVDVAAGTWHSFTLEVLSVETMAFLRESPFLFARKFSPDAILPNFTSVMLGA